MEAALNYRLTHTENHMNLFDTLFSFSPICGVYMSKHRKQIVCFDNSDTYSHFVPLSSEITLLVSPLFSEYDPPCEKLYCRSSLHVQREEERCPDVRIWVIESATWKRFGELRNSIFSILYLDIQYNLMTPSIPFQIKGFDCCSLTLQPCRNPVITWVPLQLSRRSPILTSHP